MTFNGLPLHPLVVHLTVVLVPVSVLLAWLSLHPRFRDRLRWPVVGLAVLGALLTWFTVRTGESLLNARPFLHTLVQRHQTYANELKWWAYGFGLLAVVRGVLSDRPGAVRWLLAGLVIGVGAVVLAYLYLTGDAGARMVYG